jgi:hypothetical protein
LKISGKFEVNLKPLEPYNNGADGVKIGRMSIDKTFSGELSAVSKGEMINALSPESGFAGYCAIEQVTGTLSGKIGSFVLQHYATMDNQTNFLLIEIVPGSGTGELKGISGKMAIRIEDKQHFYDFDYDLY